MDDPEAVNQAYISHEPIPKTRVKWLNADNFKKEVLNDKKVKHCMIEVIKDHCPACF